MVCIFLTSISSRKKIIPLLLSCLILSLFAGFRDKNIGSDTDFYPHWYISEIRYIHNLIDLITIETERNLDKGYLFLYWIASWIGNQYWIGLFLTELVISVFTFLGFIRLSRYFKTLSKILCKWKQDSAVSLFLYLDSVFKNKHKLIHNQAPVMNRLCPFLLNLHK